MFQKSLCNVIDAMCIICMFSKVEHLDKEHMLQKLYQRSYISISSDLCNAIKIILGKISCYWGGGL